MRVLDLGCGSSKCPGAIGADITSGSDADVRVDLSRFHYPFVDAGFDRIVMNHVIEHLPDTVGVMAEIWRIAAPGAIVEGLTPHFSSSASYADPTHCHHFALRTFEFLATKPTLRRRGLAGLLRRLYYAEPFQHRPEVAQQFDLVSVRLSFNPVMRKLGIERAANIYPELYEAFFAFIVPARNIEFKLRVRKQAHGS